VDVPGSSTALLVAGQAGHLTSSGRVTRNLLRFRDLKQNGSPIRLIDEMEFLRLLGAIEEAGRSLAPVHGGAGQPDHRNAAGRRASWLRKGLLQPARTTNRLAWFEISDILQARNLAADRARCAGIPRSAQAWNRLPEAAGGQPGLGRLEAFEQRPAREASGRRLG